jgi:Fe-S-cluster-containing dehydrogenase component
MKQGYLIIDPVRCHGCHNCAMACKDEFTDNSYPGYAAPQARHGQSYMRLPKKERGRYPMVDVVFLPTPCQHCGNAPCMAAGGDAVFRSPSGAVVIDPEKAAGSRDLPASCPYGAVTWDEERKLPQKCDLCAHLLDAGWEKPRCVMACPTGALEFRLLEPAELEKAIRSEGLEPYHPEYGTAPRVLYRNLYRFTSSFIGGSVVLGDDCLPGADVECRDDAGELMGAAVTNTFGEFRLDGLLPGRYTLTISHPDCTSVLQAVPLTIQSTYLGVIELTPKNRLEEAL